MIIPITVVCNAGYRGEQEPRSFEMGGNTVAVATIVDRWLNPDHRYFKIVGGDHCTYIICHDEITRTWEPASGILGERLICLKNCPSSR